jgi:L-alanine-DL-glutamate epimerase-like enolase superfamily enzyme
MLTSPIAVDPDGMVTMPSAPGLGVELDLERVQAHGTPI